MRIAVNVFSDWTDEEYEAHLGLSGIVPVPDYNPPTPVVEANHGRFLADDEIDWGELPTSVDWVAAGKVGSVRDQLSASTNCVSNWAIAATASLESANAIVNDLTTIAVEDDPATLEIDESVPPTFEYYSEQQLIDCATAEGNTGCDGGLPSWAFEYATNNPLHLTSDFAYTGTTAESCTLPTGGEPYTTL